MFGSELINNHKDKERASMDKDIANFEGPAETVVGPSVKIQGDLNSEGNINIEGQVAGKVATSQGLFVKSGGKIMADVMASNAVIGGEVQGNLKITGHLILQSTAKVSGDIACVVLRVEDGASFTGKCNMKGSGKEAANGRKAAAAETELAEEE